MYTLEQAFDDYFGKIMEECRKREEPYPYPAIPPESIKDMEYREEFGFNYDLYLEELNKSKKDN